MFESSSTSKEMNCFARGNPTEVTYRWYRQNVEIQTSTKNLIIENGGKRLRFVTPTRAMATKYSCSGENIYGQGDRKGADLVVTCMYFSHCIFIYFVSSHNKAFDLTQIYHIIYALYTCLFFIGNFPNIYYFTI